MSEICSCNKWWYSTTALWLYWQLPLLSSRRRTPLRVSRILSKLPRSCQWEELGREGRWGGSGGVSTLLCRRLRHHAYLCNRIRLSRRLKMSLRFEGWWWWWWSGVVRAPALVVVEGLTGFVAMLPSSESYSSTVSLQPVSSLRFMEWGFGVCMLSYRRCNKSRHFWFILRWICSVFVLAS